MALSPSERKQLLAIQNIIGAMLGDETEAEETPAEDDGTVMGRRIFMHHVGEQEASGEPQEGQQAVSKQTRIRVPRGSRKKHSG